ncbi:50S ribosomal protein L15e [Candidatus Woesearchaeota archaeon]|nr:50S ribosomal protein L15e [Candidatus Woesearchaeota archaeon]
MGYLKYVREAWKNPRKHLGKAYQDKLIKWRKEPVTVRVERPTRIDRARSLGYKAKQGVIVVRQRVSKGGHVRPAIKGGRRPKTNTRRMALKVSYQVIAEQRANKKYPNCEVAGSYLAAEDGQHKWFEIILYDRDHPVIKADERLRWAYDARNKAARGLTSAGRKSRGLRNKGKGAEKARPSRAAAARRKSKD